MRENLEQILTEIRTALHEEDGGAKLTAVVRDVHPADIADLFPLLDAEDQSKLIFLLPARATAEVIAELDDADRGDAVDDLDEAALTEIVSEMSPDDAADFLGELTDAQREEVLDNIADARADQLEGLLEHHEESAGGIMTPDLVSQYDTATVGEAIEQVRKMAEDEEVHFVYTVNKDGQLTGLVPLRRLVTSPKNTPLSAICERDPVTVHVNDDQELVANKIRRYDVSAAPVVDDEGRLVGQVTYDDIMDVAEEEADEDIYYMAGTRATELEEPGARRAAMIRLRWLAFCLVGTAVSAAVVCFLGGRFSKEISFALFLFVPMMGAMGGNAGIQISTIIIRSLASGDLESKRIGRDFGRELPISLIMAPVCGIGAALIAWLGIPVSRMLFSQGVDAVVDVRRLALSVGIGMTVGIVTASLLGMSLPHLFRKIGVDPAIASGPIVTTANDIISVTVYLTVATLIMR